MGVELLNNFAKGLYCGSTGSACGFETSGCATNEISVAESGNDVKHTLKSKVMERLKNRGLDTITADFSPKPTYPMTEEEIEKDRKRKQSNRDSAQRCREKQKKDDERNTKLLAQLQKERDLLLNKVKESEEEKNKLLFNLRSILPDYCIQETLSKIKPVTNKKEESSRQMELRQSNEKKTARRGFPTEMFYSNEAQVPNCFIFTENFIFEENCSNGEFTFTSLNSISENERHVEGIVDYLEVGNEETVQFLEYNLEPVENIEVQSSTFQEQVISETWI